MPCFPSRTCTTRIPIPTPCQQVLDAVVTDPFLRNWMDLLCFLLSGLPAKGAVRQRPATLHLPSAPPSLDAPPPVSVSCCDPPLHQ